MALNANNGAFLCQKFASKANFWEHGFAYRFPPLEEHEKEKFASFDLDPIEVMINGQHFIQCSKESDTVFTQSWHS